MSNAASLPFVAQQTEALAAALLHEIGESKFAAWFNNAVFERGADGALVVVVETKFMADWIRTHFEGDLRHAALRTLGVFKEVRIIVSPKASQSLSAPSDSAPLSNVVQFPLWSEPVRGVPNSFLRSAIFPAIQPKNRLYLHREVIASLDGVKISFTGKQLCQSDFDVLLEAMHLARYHPLGHTCHFKGYSFLKSLGRGDSKKDYDWLDDVLAYSEACAIEVKIGNRSYSGNLFHARLRDDETREYKITFNPLFLNLFLPDDWTGLQLIERQALIKKPLAQWLHGFYASHASAYPMKVETLHRLSGSANKSLRSFKQELRRAFAVLERFGWHTIFDADKITVERPPSEAQVRHLTKKAEPPKRLPKPSSPTE